MARCTVGLTVATLVQGMGEGEGAKDVSDQIEDEDQLLGARQKDAPTEQHKVPLPWP